MAQKKKLLKVKPADVDRLGTLKAEIKTAENEANEIIDRLKDILKPGQHLSGKNFTAKCDESLRRTFDNMAIYKKLGKAKYIEVSSVPVKQLDALLGKQEIDELTTGSIPTKSLKVRAI